MHAKVLFLLVILCLFSFSDAAIIDFLRSGIQYLGYEAFSLLLQNSPWLCTTFRDLIGNAEVDIDIESIFFVYNTTDTYLTIEYSEAAETIATIAKENPDDKVVIFLHGFTGNTDKPSFRSIKDALYLRGDRNVFYMDSRDFIGRDYNYFQAIKNGKVAAEAAAQILVEVTNLGIDRTSITVVGLSLGGVMAGLIGQAYTNATGVKLGRVTGLDPSGICYDFLENSEKITANDAEFVDIWRTDIDGFGYYNQVGSEPVGDADYFANGGLIQPGSFLDSHSRVLVLYAESIVNPQAYFGVKCDNYNQFKAGTCSNVTSYIGYYNIPSIRGNYYFQTLATSPYGLGTEGATYNEEYDA